MKKDLNSSQVVVLSKKLSFVTIVCSKTNKFKKFNELFSSIENSRTLSIDIQN